MCVGLSPYNAFSENSGRSIQPAAASGVGGGIGLLTQGACQSSFSRDTGVLAACTVFYTCLWFSACTLQGTGSVDERGGSCETAFCCVANSHVGMAFFWRVFGYKGPFPMASVLEKDICYPYQLHFLFIPAALACKMAAQSSLLII